MNKETLEELEKLGFKEIAKTYDKYDTEKNIFKKIRNYFNKKFFLRVDRSVLEEYGFVKYEWCKKINGKNTFVDYRRYSEDNKFLVVVGTFENKNELVFYKARKKGMYYSQTYARKKVIIDLINDGLVKEKVNVKESN